MGLDGSDYLTGRIVYGVSMDSGEAGWLAGGAPSHLCYMKPTLVWMETRPDSNFPTCLPGLSLFLSLHLHLSLPPPPSLSLSLPNS